MQTAWPQAAIGLVSTMGLLTFFGAVVWAAGVVKWRVHGDPVFTRTVASRVVGSNAGGLATPEPES